MVIVEIVGGLVAAIIILVFAYATLRSAWGSQDDEVWPKF